MVFWQLTIDANDPARLGGEAAFEGASVERRSRDSDPDDPSYYVVMHDPEGNEFCGG